MSEFRSGIAWLHCSPFVTVKINGFGKFLEQSKFVTLTVSGHLKHRGCIYHVSHIRTLRKTSGTRRGVHRVTSRETALSLVTNDEQLFRILTFGPISK